jgi:hypothetical protein
MSAATQHHPFRIRSRGCGLKLYRGVRSEARRRMDEQARLLGEQNMRASRATSCGDEQRVSRPLRESRGLRGRREDLLLRSEL